MRKNIYSKWLSGMKKAALLVIGVFAVHSLALAQLSGNYTIDKGSATSGTNFASFSDLSSALRTSGVSGAVTVTVKSGSGPYTEQVRFTAITGASSTNTITIDGNGETLQFSATSSSNSHTIRLDGTDYMTIKNMTVASTGSSYGRCVHLRNQADYNVLDGLDLRMPNMSSTSNYNAYVMIANGNSSPTSSRGDAGENNTIQNCKTSAASGRGPYSAMAQYNPTSGKYVNNWINNDVKDFYYNGFYMYHCVGQNIRGNNIHNTGNNRTGTKYGIYTYNYNGHQIGHTIVGNKIHDLRGTVRNTNTTYGIYIYGYYSTGGSEPLIVNDNDIEIINNGSNYGIYNYSYRSSISSHIIMTGNKIRTEYNNTSYYSQYAIYNYFYYAQQLDYFIVDENNIHMTSTRYTYAIYNYGYYTSGATQVSSCSNNSINLESGYYAYGILNYLYNNRYGCNTYYNSINLTEPSGTTSTGYAYLLYEYYNNANVKNNIVNTDWQGGTVRMAYYYNTGTTSWDYNNWYHENATSGIEWYDNGTYRNTFDQWISGSGGANSMYLDPNFKDALNNDLTPSSFQMVNRGTPITTHTKDRDGVTRNTTNPDIGAIEFYIDVELSAEKMSGNNECGGFQEPVIVTIKNNTSDTLSDIPLAYDVNGMNKVSETFMDKLSPGASSDYTFNRIPEFNGTASHTVNIYLDGSDDMTSNNLQTHGLNTIESPFGSELVEKGTYAGYFALGGNGGSMAKPDVTVPGYKVEYEIQHPTRHSNSTYGTATGWELTPMFMTAGGTTPSGITFNAPSGGAAGTVEFDPPKSLMDSMVYIGFAVKDNNTGCDSMMGRWVFVPHIPEVDFEIQDVCDGDVVSVTNRSTLAKGIMTYYWDFNDSNSTEDFSEISDPVYKYSTYGNYDIVATIGLFDYPKFEFKKTKSITINPVPIIDFKVLNACEGEQLTFNNKTTSPIGGTIDYVWDFGDGSAPTTVESPKHMYNKPGGYRVTLTANLKGCIGSLTKNANQFDRPEASFSVDGNCNLEDVKFNNSSVIEIGRSGYRWDFGDGDVSSLENPTHAFANAGQHTVKMTAVSEFGCEDQTEQTFTLNESPKADFDFSDPCNLTEVAFTRTGTLPAGNSIYEWDFNGQGNSTQENPKFLFPKVGVKHVSLKISSENGCVDEITKEFVVKLQAQADFVANNVCEGEEVVFTNKSSVAAGGLDYLWRFGDGSTSNLTSPRHGFTLSTQGETESFNVTLVARVPGGCSDSIAKAVTVNANSDPYFMAETSGRNLTIKDQKTTNTDFIYNWQFGDGARSADVTPTHTYFNVDEGEFEVCLGIINNANCLSEYCQSVNVDLVGIADLEMDNDMVNAYPNPNNGLFTVDVKDPQSNLKIAIINVMGEVIAVETPQNLSGSYRFDLSTVASGVYMLQVRNGDFGSVQRITINR